MKLTTITVVTVDVAYKFELLQRAALYKILLFPVGAGSQSIIQDSFCFDNDRIAYPNQIPVSKVLSFIPGTIGEVWDGLDIGSFMLEPAVYQMFLSNSAYVGYTVVLHFLTE